MVSNSSCTLQEAPWSFSKCSFSGPVSDFVNQNFYCVSLEKLQTPPARLCDYVFQG